MAPTPQPKTASPHTHPPVAPAAASLSEDPAWLAYMRALGYEQSDAERIAAQRSNEVRRRYALLLPELQMAGENQRTAISGGMESRGIYRSGEHEMALARQRAAEQQQLGSMGSEQTAALGGIEGDLAALKARILRAQSEKAYGTASGIGDYNAAQSAGYSGGG